MTATIETTATATIVGEVDLGGLNRISQVHYRLSRPAVSEDGSEHSDVVISTARVASFRASGTVSIVETIVLPADADGRTLGDVMDLLPMDNPADHADALARLGYTLTR